MWPGYLAIGGLEVGNSARTIAYTQTNDCPTFWLKDVADCGTLQNALNHDPYTYADIEQAPWYDPDLADVAARFYGVYIISMEGVQDSTREASVTQRLQDGGRIGRIRRATREIRVRVMLTAQGDDAMEYGLSWLDSVLSPGACGSHGTACGVTDMEYFSACPPAPVDPDDAEGYADLVNQYRRFFHDVACTSGPFTVEQYLSTNELYSGRIVEFSITCENPWTYGVTTQVEVPSVVPTLIQDIAYNLAPYPSAELDDGTPVVVATNYSTNPSVETNATGWTGAVTGTGLSASSGRVTGELASVGTASFRVVATAASGSTNGTVRAEQQVALGGPSGSRYSISMWAAAVVTSGTPNLGNITYRAYWRATAGGSILRTDVLGTVDSDGGAVSVQSIQPPATAAFVTVRAELAVSSYANGNVIRLYADALAVTNP